MSLLASLNNKIQYNIAKAAEDPAADAYAKQQEKQAKQDAEVAKRKKEEEEKKALDEENKRREEERAKKLAARSKFSVGGTISQAAKGIITFLIVLVFFAFMFYGGHIAANKDIGYSMPGRLVSFAYGSLMAWYLVPKALLDTYWFKKQQPFYAFLPITTYVPQGTFQEIFLGPFCYTEDDASQKAREAVKAMYEAAYPNKMDVLCQVKKE